MTPPRPISLRVATDRRPSGLRRPRGSRRQSDPGSEIEVVVVDNDAERSAAAVVEEARAELPGLRLVYAAEPERNIALARNAAVRLASGDRFAFIDDDEVPSMGGWPTTPRRSAATVATACSGRCWRPCPRSRRAGWCAAVSTIAPGTEVASRSPRMS